MAGPLDRFLARCVGEVGQEARMPSVCQSLRALRPLPTLNSSSACLARIPTRMHQPSR